MTRKNMSGIPDRWLKYSKHGKVLIERFIALKVPLSRRIRGVPYNDTFLPEYVAQKLPIGLIIDLTNTSRYYDPSEFTSKGVDHVKLNVPGKQIPPWKIVQRFIEIVKGYLNDPNWDGKLIGVHCTHGLNRTGYMVCAYMILEMGYSPREAIQLFNDARGHRMERDNYLKSLQEMCPSGGHFNGGRHRSQPPEREERRQRRHDSQERSDGRTGPSFRRNSPERMRPADRHHSQERSHGRNGSAFKRNSPDRMRPSYGQGSQDRSMNGRMGPPNRQDSNERSNWRMEPQNRQDRNERSNWRMRSPNRQDSNERSNWRMRSPNRQDSNERSNGRMGPPNRQGSNERLNWRMDPASRNDSHQQQQSRQPAYAWKPWNERREEPSHHGQERWDPSIRRIVRPRQHNYRVPSYRRTDGDRQEQQRQHIKFD